MAQTNGSLLQSKWYISQHSALRYLQTQSGGGGGIFNKPWSSRCSDPLGFYKLRWQETCSMLEYFFVEYALSLREARVLYGLWRGFSTIWKEDLCGRVCRAKEGVSEKGMEIVLFAANYHLGCPLPNELAEMIASYIPRCELHSSPWTAGYNDDRANSRTSKNGRLWSSETDATVGPDECSNSDYLSEMMLVDPNEASTDEYSVIRQSANKRMNGKDEPNDDNLERLLLERQTRSCSSPKWFKDVLYSSDWRQSSWITLVRGGMRKDEPCRELMIRFAGFGSGNGGADVR